MTRLPSRIDLQIEPLSERSWHRVEDGVFAQLDGAAPQLPTPLPTAVRPARWRTALTIGGFATAAAAAAVAVFALSARDDAASPLRASRVQTAEAATRVTHGEASLVVASRSALVLSGDDERGLLVVLEHGRVDCSVPPRRGRPAFAIQAGDVRVEVVGTRFAVSRAGDEAAVEVTEGVVAVIADGERVLVRAGERWPATVVADVPDTDPEPELEMEPDLLGDAGERRADRARTNRRRRTAPIELPPDLAPPPTAKERFETAASLEASDPDAAAAIYRELARGRGAWAANALYARARLELDRDRRRTAAQLLREYLDRFPDGANADDARALLETTK